MGIFKRKVKPIQPAPEPDQPRPAVGPNEPVPGAEAS